MWKSFLSGAIEGLLNRIQKRTFRPRGVSIALKSGTIATSHRQKCAHDMAKNQPQIANLTEMTVTKYFTVWPDEAETLKNADQKQLIELINQLDFSSDSGEKKPLKLRIPQPLRDSLEVAHKLGHKKIDVLLSAANEYRRRHPWESDWEELPAPVENEPKGGDRQDLVLRLSATDRKLLQDIGRGCSKVANRYEALTEMASIIREMKLPDLTKRRRISVYLVLTQELNDVLERRHRESKVSRVQILLQALNHRAASQ